MSEISYQEAVDKVCFECELDDRGNACEACPVRQMISIKENPRYTDKKKNMEYWDEIERGVAEAVKKCEVMAANFKLKEIGDDDRLDVVKKATETIIEELTYYGLIFPYVDGEA